VLLQDSHTIKPFTMPLMTLAATAIDQVTISCR